MLVYKEAGYKRCSLEEVLTFLKTVEIVDISYYAGNHEINFFSTKISSGVYKLSFNGNTMVFHTPSQEFSILIGSILRVFVDSGKYFTFQTKSGSKFCVQTYEVFKRNL